jgi:hypothetical protein
MNMKKFTLPDVPITISKPLIYPIYLKNIGSGNCKARIDLNHFYSENNIDHLEGIITFKNTEI